MGLPALTHDTSISFTKKLAIFQHLTKVGCRLLTDLKAVSNESDDLLNDTTTSSPSPQARAVMSWVYRLSVVLVYWFGLIFYVPVNSYGHVETVCSPNHTFYWVSLTKRLTSTSCTNVHL